MRVRPKEPPREFEAGAGRVRLKDCGRIEMAADELVTFVTSSGKEYDVVRKSWGFYATPSTNGRLAQFDLRTALVRSDTGKFFVLIVEKGEEAAFERYLQIEKMRVAVWLDDPQSLERLAAAFGAAR